jgi:hypothetical protein
LLRWWAEATGRSVEEAVPAKARALWYATRTDEDLEEMMESGVDPYDGVEIVTGDPWFDDYGK